MSPMNDLRFQIELRWSGTGRDGAGEILTDDLRLELSAALDRAKLPVDSLAVDASGTVTGLPGPARFAGIVVRPTILGGDLTRQPEYEAAARLAHDRCFIGRALAPEVSYEVGSVQVREAAPLAMTSVEARAHGERADRVVVGPRSSNARKARASA
jgi:hypothetical protein